MFVWVGWRVYGAWLLASGFLIPIKLQWQSINHRRSIWSAAPVVISKSNKLAANRSDRENFELKTNSNLTITQTHTETQVQTLSNTCNIMCHVYANIAIDTMAIVQQLRLSNIYRANRHTCVCVCWWSARTFIKCPPNMCKLNVAKLRGKPKNKQNHCSKS